MVSNPHIGTQQFPFFIELLAHKYETVENGGGHLRFWEEWPTFAHLAISIVSIFIGNFLRFYKTSGFDTCTKYSHTHMLSNAHIGCRQFPFFGELLVHKYETVEIGEGHLRFSEEWPTFAH